MEEEILDLVDKQIQKAISNALNCLTKIPSSKLRYRSSSNNRKVPFHNTIPRYSLPTTQTDLVCQTLQNNYHRTFDVQYSFSLTKPWVTKINQRRYHLINIQNFVNELIEHSIRTALLQIVNEDQTSTPSQLLNTYANEFIHSTIEQAIENISASTIECLSNRLTNDIINDALSTILDNEIYSTSMLTDDEKYLQKIKTKSIQLEDTDQNQIPYHSLTNSSDFNEVSIDSLVSNIAQQVYMNSFDALKQIFTNDNNTD